MISVFSSNDQQTTTLSETNPVSSVRADKRLTNQDESDFPSIRISLSPEAQKYLKGSEKAPLENAATFSRPKIQNRNDKNSSPAPKLTPAQMNLLQRLKARDLHVRAHEAAHMAIAGNYVRGGPSYVYEMGPDNLPYAVGGEIQLDTSPIPGDPQGTIAKAEAIRKSALAPSDPSGADLSVAAGASQLEAQAQQELSELQSKAAEKEADITNPIEAGRKTIIAAYQKFINQLLLGQVVDQNA